ncbi:hypothetical protein, partial [Xanthomonas fragariae]
VLERSFPCRHSLGTASIVYCSDLRRCTRAKDASNDACAKHAFRFKFSHVISSGLIVKSL